MENKRLNIWTSVLILERILIDYYTEIRTDFHLPFVIKIYEISQWIKELFPKRKPRSAYRIFNLYPTPGSVWMYVGRDGSGSIFPRRLLILTRKMCMSS